ncbi:MAG: RluA family pseudouridine synthase [Dehalococcoidia bacterium]
MNKLQLRVEGSGQRLDAFIAGHQPDISRAYARRLIDEGLVSVDGRPVKAAARLLDGQSVEISLPEPVATGLVAEDLPLEVLYEDADLVAVNKAPGMPVHPSPGHDRGTLVNALLARYPDIGPLAGELRPGIVHRLDKDTSGVMVVARNSLAMVSLTRQIKAREVDKVYLALVEGSLQPPRGVIEAPVGRDPRERRRQAVVEGGREARTGYRVLLQGDTAGLVEVVLETGRTHQIRVHMAAVGHAVVGDALYGRRSAVIRRQALHSWKLGFKQPTSGERIDVEAPPPADFLTAAEALGLTPVPGLDIAHLS